MSMHGDGLTFNVLREANQKRLPTFRGRKGNICHPEDGSNDWSLNDWGVAVTGELGEACSILKQVRRGDMTLEEARPALAKELADVATYLDILADQAGIDLGDAIVQKFNEVSKRVNSHIEIEASGRDWGYSVDWVIANGKDGTLKMLHFPERYKHHSSRKAWAADFQDCWKTGEPCSCVPESRFGPAKAMP